MSAALASTGFVHCGQWLLQNDTLHYEADAKMLRFQNILYAFTSGDDILYIGKTTQMVKKRLELYRAPTPTQPGGIKNHAYILHHLRTSCPIDIFVLQDQSLRKTPAHDLHPATVLEEKLIRQFRPKWNPGTLHPDKPRAPRLSSEATP